MIPKFLEPITNEFAGEMHASRVRLPADMIAVADSNGDGRGDYSISPKPSSNHIVPGRIHGGGANVLFCDGHVTHYRQEELLIAERRDLHLNPVDAPKYRMWNNDHRSPWDDLVPPPFPGKGKAP